MRSIEEIKADIHKTKKGLNNARRKARQCSARLAELERELKEKQNENG